MLLVYRVLFCSQFYLFSFAYSHGICINSCIQPLGSIMWDDDGVVMAMISDIARYHLYLLTESSQQCSSQAVLVYHYLVCS